MSYTVLARRYRSATFDDVVGQEHIAQTLKKAIASDRVAHAYLFCGTRGTGKTSTARILAKALNCESSDKPTPTPCNKCESCKAIARGDDIDVIEIDAASHTGVDNVRELISNAQFMPARSRFKIYIIDEVHMLSKQAFNALLKTMEEPPSHVKFILATTEPEKVLPTILSRCQRYDFRNIPAREIAGHLKNICKQEKIEADDEALLLIAKAGAGSMRDSLSLLDRLLSIGEKELTIDLIESLLGLPKSQLIFDLAQSIGLGEVKAVLTQTDKLIQSGLSTDTLIASIVDHLRNLLILRTCGPDSDMVEVPGLNPKDLNAQATQFDPIALAQNIAILEELRRNIRTSQAGRAILDATLVRLALSDQFTSIADLLNSDGAPRTSALSVKKKCPEPLTAAPPPVEATPASRSSLPPSPSEDEEDDLPAPGKVWDNSGPSLKELLAAQSANAQETSSPTAAVPPENSEPPNFEPVAVTDLPQVWRQLLTLLAERGPSIHSLVSQGKLVAIEDGQAIIHYAQQHETFVKLLDKSNTKRDVVREVLTKVVGSPLGVSFKVSADSDTAVVIAAVLPTVRSLPKPVRREVHRPPEPAPIAAAPTIKLTQELEDSLKQSEPLIRALMEAFGAKIVKVEEA